MATSSSSSSSSSSDFLASTGVGRSLADSRQDVRKKGAQEVEAHVKTLRQNGDWAGIHGLVLILAKQFVRSVQPSQRKGGLLALSATSVALFADIGPFLRELVDPILECFADQDATVRFHACETMYNVAKVARADILPYFVDIFEGLIRLSGDNESKVQNASYTLDRLVKDVATETTSFDMPSFIGLIRKHVVSNNPYTRQFLVGWLQALDAVPDVHLVQYLPEYLDGLLTILSDKNKEIVQATQVLLNELKGQLHQGPPSIYGPLTNILLSHCSSKEETIRLTALSWLLDFLEHGKEKMLPFMAELLLAVLPCISDKEEAVRNVATRVNQAMVALVDDGAGGGGQNGGKAEAPGSRKCVIEASLGEKIMAALQHLLTRFEVRTRMATLHWLLLLLGVDAKKLVLPHFDSLFPLLLRTLSDASSSEDVVTMALSVLAQLSVHHDNIKKFMFDLVDLLKKERKKMLMRSSAGLVIRQVALLIDPERVFREIAAILIEEPDIQFVSDLVQTLNTILLTAAELAPLRTILRRGLGPSSSVGNSSNTRTVFSELYMCWSHSATATLSLCLLAMAYEHAYVLVRSFGEMEVTVGFLTQLDKLVQLLESPIFAHVRLQLLEPHAHPFLVKTLFGILMLLPQSSAHELLRKRLKSVATISLANWALTNDQSSSQGGGGKAQKSAAGAGGDGIDWDKLLSHFTSVQKRILLTAATTTTIASANSGLMATGQQPSSSD